MAEQEAKNFMPERAQRPFSPTRGNDPSVRSQQGDDFALDAVPDHAVTAAYKIGIMLLAANISLPALIMGGQLGVELRSPASGAASFWPHWRVSAPMLALARA